MASELERRPDEQRDALERRLARGFDEETLTVYGDYLQSLGDPRGELIALDLDARTDTAADSRRKELIARWLGDDIAQQLGLSTIEHGFITDLYLEDTLGHHEVSVLASLLQGPGAQYICGVTAIGNAGWLQRVLALLAARRHDWIRRFSIRVLEPDPRCSVALTATMLRMMPQLEELEVWGDDVAVNAGHPTVRSLRITGYRVVHHILQAAHAFPEVRVLDLAFVSDNAGEYPWYVDSPLVLQLPRLRRLDLSRNEPGTTAPYHLGGEVDPFRYLARLSLRNQLTHVRLPSLRTRYQAEDLESAIRGMPAAREITLARSYREFAYLNAPEVVKVPVPWPWLPADQFASINEIRFVSDAQQVRHVLRGYRVSFSAMVSWIEDHFYDLPEPTQRAWSQLLESLPRQQPVRLPRRALDHLLGRLSPGELPEDWAEPVGFAQRYNDPDLALSIGSP